MTDLIFPAILPEILLCLAGLILMMTAPFLRNGNRLAPALALAGLVASAAATWPFWAAGQSAHSFTAFGGMISQDLFGLYLRLLFLTAAALLTLAASTYLERNRLPRIEFYALLLFAVAGMNLMVMAHNLVMAFVGLEILSVASYILAGFQREKGTSNEAGLKYFFVGSFSSAILLYGIALIYGAAGSLDYGRLAALAPSVRSLQDLPLLLILGSGLVIAGLFFKVAAAPFHIWTPDVYEGAPAPVTAFLSVGPKAAGFALLLRFLMQVTPWDWPLWTQMVVATAVLTMFIGNLAAIAQRSVKRMLAYSAIAHAGYLLVGVSAASATGVAAILFYVVAYTLMNLGAFTLVAILSGSAESRVDLEDYRGLGFRHPALGFSLTVLLLSLAGIPATGGFIGKFFLFAAAADRNLYPLVVLAVLASLVSTYFYLRVVVYLFMKEPEEGRQPEPAEASPMAAAVSIFCAVAVIVLGLFPGPLLEQARAAAEHFLGLS